MAKSGFWLRGAKGKLAGTVLYQSGGRTLQREVVTPNNPQTMGQMRQRVAFATAAKFYQDAQQNRFALAYAGKKANQSDFNMFMKENLKAGIAVYPTQEMVNNPGFCAYAPWIVSTGNLQSIPVAEVDDHQDIIGAAIRVTDIADDSLTSWDEVIAANPTLNLQYGDIITVTAVMNDMGMSFDGDYNIVLGDRTPIWVTRQIIIGADLGQGTLADYLTANGFEDFTFGDSSSSNAIGIPLDEIYGGVVNYGEDGNVPVMCCVTRSRVEGSKTEVSFSQFHLTPYAQGINYALTLAQQADLAARSYMKSKASAYPTEVLQGSIAVEATRFTEMNYRTKSGNDGVRHSFPAVLADNISSVTFEGAAAGGAEASMNRWSLKGEGESEGTYTVESTGSKVKLIAQPYTMKMADGTFETATMGVWALDADLTTPIDYTVKFNGTTILTAKLAKKA